MEKNRFKVSALKTMTYDVKHPCLSQMMSWLIMLCRLYRVTVKLYREEKVRETKHTMTFAAYMHMKEQFYTQANGYFI